MEISIEIVTELRTSRIKTNSRVTVLRGASGVGKTALAKAIVLSEEEILNNPLRGNVRIGSTNFPFGGKPKNINIAFIPEATIDAFVCSNIDDELLLSVLLASPGAKLSAQGSSEVLARSPLRKATATRIGQLSGGQQLLLAVETAVIANPDLILIDSGLDCLDQVSRDYVQLRLNDYLEKQPNGLVLILCRENLALPHVEDVNVYDFPDLGLLANKDAAEDESNIGGTTSEAVATTVEFTRLTGGYRSLGLWTIRSCDFKIGQSRCVGITGANGSGKSTLLKLMSGALEIVSGDVYFGENSLRDGRWPGRGNGIAYLSQDGAGAMLFSEIELAATDAVRASESGSADLPSGQRFVRAVTEAFASGPTLWLFDEPTGHVESSVFKRLLSSIRARRKGTSVVLVTHDAELMQDVCDERYELVQGDISQLVRLD